MARRPPSPKPPAAARDPYIDLEVGHHVMLSSPLVDPIHWHPGKVLWRDAKEVLVDSPNFSSKLERHLRSIDDVRVFGTREHCAVEQRRAEKVVRDAANLSKEVEDMAAELRRKMVDLFETAAAAALKSCGAPS